MTVLPRPEGLFLDAAAPEQGVELKVQGVVQGVGFRPFVHRLATQFGFSGTVVNCADGVVIRLAPPLAGLDRFLQSLHKQAPPLARISSVTRTSIDGFPGQPGFFILHSEKAGTSLTMIPPDAAICADCLAELNDSSDKRRYLYPFINCTNCGPRFTIVESIPYDRPKTSMKVFPMCPVCGREYHDPADRRFHAQPNACWQCGPRLSWHDGQGRLIPCSDPVREAVAAIRQGRVIAMRGLGGFHLVVDAGSEEAVCRLRHRKNRPAKPLAIMVADLTTARRLCEISDAEEELLCSWQRPIVLLPKKIDSGLAPSLAPGINHLGVMLAYTPFQHLLFMGPHSPQALVMTSGNRSEEPICTANPDAVDKLAGLADFFLLHNRDIVTRVDDSVLRVMAGRGRLMRRSRGYVPEAVRLGVQLPATLACGAELKNTFCMARGNEAYLSQHIGDLASVETLDFFSESVRHMQDILEFAPGAVACDLHPDYLSTRFAEKLGLPLFRVQHHHAHAAAVMAEHGLAEDTLAVILDGSGFGPDGTVWGGEILLAGLTSFTRLASLEEIMLPGGDAAAREPWRMAMAALWAAYGGDLKAEDLVPALTAIAAAKRDGLRQMLEKKINTPRTSSCGRLFDAVAALLGLRLQADYEGQAAMELEALAAGGDRLGMERGVAGFLPVELTAGPERLLIRTGPMIRAMVRAVEQRQERAGLALAFHHWLADSVTCAVKNIGEKIGKKNVVLGGGCLQNGLLLTGLEENLRAAGFQVFAGERVPANDGGLALGQAVIAGMFQLRS
jgi:hydrogenase maturation protein HypF